MHLEIRKYGQKYSGLIRTTFREGGKIKHTTHGRIKDKSYEELKLLQAAFRGDAIIKSSPGAHKITESKAETFISIRRQKQTPEMDL